MEFEIIKAKTQSEPANIENRDREAELRKQIEELKNGNNELSNTD